jgi:hypothetical protein
MASKTNATTPSATVGSLPAFFTNAQGTVLDELADFELGVCMYFVVFVVLRRVY